MRGTRLTPEMIVDPNKISEKYREWENKVFDCRLCEGLNIPKDTEGTPGYGVVPSELMVVGQSLHGWNKETPDRQIPFVGPIAHQDSGTMLYEILRRCGYTYSNGNLYMTNVVKCHPPNNRTSTPTEVSNCHPFLVKEIHMVKPKIILTVGADARRKFKLPGMTGSRNASWYKKTFAETALIPLSVYYVIIRHPSAVMRFDNFDDQQQYVKRCCAVLNFVKRKVHDGN